MSDKNWIRGALEARGLRQVDLARAWGISQGGVSRFLNGIDQQDLPLSKAWKLAQPLGITLEELGRHLGQVPENAGTVVPGDPAQPPPVSAPPLGTVTVVTGPGRPTLLHLHVSVPYETALEILQKVRVGSGESIASSTSRSPENTA